MESTLKFSIKSNQVFSFVSLPAGSQENMEKYYQVSTKSSPTFAQVFSLIIYQLGPRTFPANTHRLTLNSTLAIFHPVLPNQLNLPPCPLLAPSPAQGRIVISTDRTSTTSDPSKPSTTIDPSFLS